MPKSIDQSAIFAAIKQGVIAALNDHHKMSGEYNVEGIPESYFQIKVADSLAAMGGGYKITLEDTYWRILEESNANRKVINALKNPQERADITIRWGENRTPRMIVELKRAIQGRALARDAVKIDDWSIDFGMIRPLQFATLFFIPLPGLLQYPGILPGPLPVDRRFRRPELNEIDPFRNHGYLWPIRSARSLVRMA